MAGESGHIKSCCHIIDLFKRHSATLQSRHKLSPGASRLGKPQLAIDRASNFFRQTSAAPVRPVGRRRW